MRRPLEAGQLPLPAAPSAVQVTLLEADDSLIKAAAATYTQGSVTAISFFGPPNDAAAIIASQDAVFQARGYKFALLGNTQPVANGPTLTALYSKEGEPDIILSAITLPDDPVSLLASFFANVPPDAANKFVRQLSGHKTLISVTPGTDLVKNFGS